MARPTATGASWALATAAPPPSTSGDSLTTEPTHDLVVIGGGLAGLTAGLFAARYGLSVLVLESVVPGGHLINVEKIEDFPGLPDGVAGYDLCPTVQEQAEKAGAQFQLAEVSSLRSSDGLWHVATGASDAPSDTLTARAVIVASGTSPKPLGLPGEDALTGRGLSHCATCDGPLFRGKPVGVAGGGTYALQEALTLSSFASHVTVFNPDPTTTAQATYQERIAEHPTITLLHSRAIQELLPDDRGALAAVRVHDLSSGAHSQVDLSALFVYAGSVPNTAFLADLLPLQSDGRIPVDAAMATPLPGLFAAGDVRANAPGHALISASDGATAAISAHRYLKQWDTSHHSPI